PRVFEGLSIYSRYWNFNAGPFWLVEGLLDSAGWNLWWLSRVFMLTGVLSVMIWQLIALHGSRPRRGSASDALLVPLGKGGRAEGARGFAGSVVTHAPLCALRGGERFFSSPGKGDDRGWLPPSTESISLLKALFYSMAALVLLSPAVQPWYICWLVPF